MNLVAFSIRTKGVYNFTRRLRTVFTRFGISETPIRRGLYTIIESLENMVEHQPSLSQQLF
jgi:hypothetical protein